MTITNQRFITWAVMSFFPVFFCGAEANAQTCDPGVAKLVSIQGEVTAQRHKQTQWKPVGFDHMLCAGDTLRVGKNSRAGVVLEGEGLLRLDQFTTLRFPEPDDSAGFWVELVRGVVHFFSHKPRQLKILTPFVNGNIEGTEFIVDVDADRTRISVLRGRVRAVNQHGELLLNAGETATATAGAAPVYDIQVRPEDAVQWALYYPLVSDFSYMSLVEDIDDTGLRNRVKEALDACNRGESSSALSMLENLPDNAANANLYTFRAGLGLLVGRVAGAENDIERALRIKANHSEALALKSVIAVTQNRKEAALELARQAVAADEKWADARIALSYAQQADFQIEAALDSLESAVALGPENAVGWSRLSELQLSVGDLKKALMSARKAVDLNPAVSHTQTVLGFAYLTQIKIDQAIASFNKAVDLDQAAPLPRLGLGLAVIRRGDLAGGRRQIEIAAGLDARNALIRSYLGKAYFDEKKDNLAGKQLEMAKSLDPLDPTAWLYDALRKQADNRPVEALRDLQKSIELNDNRAVYRSRLLLDQDLAARSASLGRIYNDLGFQQLALVEGWKSVNTDPANYSAHRLLADSYAALPRHKIARVSSLLQSQLLQPLNLMVIQPQLAETNLHIIEDTGPSTASFNEFNPLFIRNRTRLIMDGVYGDNDTWGDDLVLSGLHNSFSYSLGQFHYESDGFRENNDHELNIFNGIVHVQPYINTSLLLELRDKDQKYGDLTLRFDPIDFDPTIRLKSDVRSLRVGFRHSFSPRSNLIGTVVFNNEDNAIVDEPDAFFYNSKSDDYAGEIQHIYQTDIFSVIGGAGYLESDFVNTIDFGPLIPSTTELTDYYQNYYIYTKLNFPDTVTWSMGASYDVVKSNIDKDQVNPKFGVIWNPTADLTFRAAAFRVLNRRFINQQTIEPVQIAGFNQFFGDADGDRFWRYGAAIDYRLAPDVLGGFEISRRKMDIPYPDFSNIYQEAAWEEDSARAYLYWTPSNRLAVSVEYHYEQFDRDIECTGEELIHTLTAHRLPLGFRFFFPFGVTAGLTTTFIDQKAEFQPDIFAPEQLVKDHDSFWILDAKLSYRLPNRLGSISIEAKNLIDETFKYQPMDKFKLDISPERLIMAKVTLSF